MPDLLKNKDLIRVIFKGIPNKFERYSGDKIDCRLSSPASCVVDVSVLKACQLYADFPGQWEFPDVDMKALSLDYNPKLLVQAISKKGVTLIHASGRKEHFPAGTKFQIIKPVKEEVKVEKVIEPEPLPAEVEPIIEKTPLKSEEFPKHLGAGFYELSNGLKVRGKKKAKEAEEKLGVENAD